MAAEVATVVPRYEDEYLMLEKVADRDQTYLEFPCGTIENEEREEAALREFFEETGQVFDSVERLVSFPGYTVEKSTLDYEIYPHEVVVDEKFEPQLGVEHIDYEWVSQSFVFRNPEGKVGPERDKALEAVMATEDRYLEASFTMKEDIPTVEEIFRKYQEANF
ncbi:MAG: 8-oxo-dGTP pyrophosphatase MutT (NUDIX family) [Candidatus Nanohaloarchaea archaeon]|jgi:8-oxo-dGTP pyrophosphatase MutT (NUDIX family)